MTRHADRDRSEAYWPPAAAAAYDEPVPYVPTERTGLPEHLEALQTALDEHEGRANFWARKAETYRRQLADERAIVARVEFALEDPSNHADWCGVRAHAGCCERPCDCNLAAFRAALAEPEQATP